MIEHTELHIYRCSQCHKPLATWWDDSRDCLYLCAWCELLYRQYL